MNYFGVRTKIMLGGCLESLTDPLQRLFIVTDRFMAESGKVSYVTERLQQPGQQHMVFSDVRADPDIETVTRGVSALLDFNADGVIAFGGGSAIDAAKAMVFFAAKQRDLRDVPFIAIPTTSGTGSEVTEYSVITDRAKGLKYPLGSRAMRPPTAILDPELVVSAPPSVTADSGMDVLTHALEAYVSEGANDFSDALAEKAISLVFKWLPIAYMDGNDLLAREKMHNASCLAGLAFNSAGLGVCHGVAHAIGGKLHLPHGRANAIVLPHVLRFNSELESTRRGDYSKAAKKYQRVAKLLDFDAPSVSVGVNELVGAVQKLNKALNIPATLRAAGCDMDVFKSEREEMVKAALADVTTSFNPRKVAAEDVEKILDQVGG